MMGINNYNDSNCNGNFLPFSIFFICLRIIYLSVD